WHSQVPVPKEELTVRGQAKRLYDDPKMDESSPVLIATEAFSYPDGKQVKEVRASNLVTLPVDAKTKQVNSRVVAERSPALGRPLAELLPDFLIQINGDRSEYAQDTYRDNNYARAGSPPPLFREGEKVQPNWLFEFLRHPQPIRPMARLRMPRFNMSDDEAMALVNYFAADAKRTNPGIGLTYPYAQVPQQQEHFLDEHARSYLARYKEKQGKQYAERLQALLKDWEAGYDEQVAALKQEVENAKREVTRATDDDKRKTARAYLERVTERLKDLQKTNKKTYARAQQEDWEPHGASAGAGYRLLPSRLLCLNCPQGGGREASTPESQRGPP